MKFSLACLNALLSPIVALTNENELKSGRAFTVIDDKNMNSFNENISSSSTTSSSYSKVKKTPVYKKLSNTVELRHQPNKLRNSNPIVDVDVDNKVNKAEVEGSTTKADSSDVTTDVSNATSGEEESVPPVTVTSTNTIKLDNEDIDVDVDVDIDAKVNIEKATDTTMSGTTIAVATTTAASDEECFPPVTITNTSKLDAGNLPLSSCSSKKQICLNSNNKEKSSTSSSIKKKTGFCVDDTDVHSSYWTITDPNNKDVTDTYQEDHISTGIYEEQRVYGEIGSNTDTTTDDIRSYYYDYNMYEQNQGDNRYVTTYEHRHLQHNEDRCGCSTCVDSIWNTFAGDFKCGDRIKYLQNAKGYTEHAACYRIAGKFWPDECGGCDPDRCVELPTSAAPSFFIPSVNPSLGLSLAPSNVPSSKPSLEPSALPNAILSSVPSLDSSGEPSSITSFVPSSEPSLSSSIAPSSIMSVKPSSELSYEPSSKLSSSPSFVQIRCGCSTCVDSIWNTFSGAFYCGDRIKYLQNAKGYTEHAACSRIAGIDWPDECGGCDPDRCVQLPTSATPSFIPSVNPSLGLSLAPSNVPSSKPSLEPSASPSAIPSSVPNLDPSGEPSLKTSFVPSSEPSLLPSTALSSVPSVNPSSGPSLEPSSKRSPSPSFVPSSEPSLLLSSTPSFACPSICQAPICQAPSNCKENVTRRHKFKSIKHKKNCSQIKEKNLCGELVTRKNGEMRLAKRFCRKSCNFNC